MGTIVVAGAICLMAGLAVRSIVKGKKKGISFQCGGNCKNCAGHCSAKDMPPVEGQR